MKRYASTWVVLLLLYPPQVSSASNCADLKNLRLTVPASRNLGNGAVRTRPLCAYPKTAQWIGIGSTDDAANFFCIDGKHDARDFTIAGPGR